MSSNAEYFRVSQLPYSLFEGVSRYVPLLSTILFRISDSQFTVDKIDLIGSGTFISTGDIFGILTATHVVRQLKRSDSLGLVLAERGSLYSVEVQYLDIIEIGKYREPGEGPDIAFIKLPTSEVGKIKPYKTFLNIDNDREELLNCPPDHQDGFWLVCGAPGQFTNYEGQGIFSVGSICGIGGVQNEYEKDGYDYIESIVEYDRQMEQIDNIEIPESLGGMSGGGLWQVMVGISEEECIPLRYILYGVAFCQSKFEENRRILKCHGRKSIYKYAYEAIRKCS